MLDVDVFIRLEIYFVIFDQMSFEGKSFRYTSGGPKRIFGLAGACADTVQAERGIRVALAAPERKRFDDAKHSE
jgi:hypothetical protein